MFPFAESDGGDCFFVGIFVLIFVLGPLIKGFVNYLNQASTKPRIHRRQRPAAPAKNQSFGSPTWAKPSHPVERVRAPSPPTRRAARPPQQQQQRPVQRPAQQRLAELPVLTPVFDEPEPQRLRAVGSLADRHVVDDHVRQDIVGHVTEHMKPFSPEVQPETRRRKKKVRRVVRRKAEPVAIRQPSSIDEIGGDRSTLQRAVLLREIFGPPVALQRMRRLGGRQ